VARWIPQCLYYFYACSRLPKNGKKVVFSVPSGNFGNLAAGILAQKMGLPIAHFIATTNENKVVPEFLAGKRFLAKPSVQTVSNSMDVGNPSNFPRLLALYDFDENRLKDHVTGAFYSDAETIVAIQDVKKRGYILDPHGAVGYLGLVDFMRVNEGFQGVFLETAHPGKFRDVVEKALGEKVILPERLAAFLEGEKEVIPMRNDFEEFKGFLTALI
jgi:threonine synthase